jgi:hypothetical protein
MNKTNRYALISVLLVLGLILAGCAALAPQKAIAPKPGATPIATSTVPLPSPLSSKTPPPTDTALPPSPSETATQVAVSYALIVKVMDARNQPVKNATLNLSELGSSAAATQPADINGQVSWTDLPFTTVSLTVKAPGYKPIQESVPLQAGPNLAVVKLELDPFGLLPGNACAVNEKPLYIADFQDNQAAGWTGVAEGAKGWSLGPDPAQPGNIVMIARGSPDGMAAAIDLSNFTFTNAVWRVSVKFDGGAKIFNFLNWMHTLSGGDVRYFVNLGPEVPVDLTRFNNGESIVMGRSTILQIKDKWARYEVSTYNGTTEVWINGKKAVSFTDTDPIQPGTIGFEPHYQFDSGAFYYDNISVCGLSAPFKSLKWSATR